MENQAIRINMNHLNRCTPINAIYAYVVLQYTEFRLRHATEYAHIGENRSYFSLGQLMPFAPVRPTGLALSTTGMVYTRARAKKIGLVLGSHNLGYPIGRLLSDISKQRWNEGQIAGPSRGNVARLVPGVVYARARVKDNTSL